MMCTIVFVSVRTIWSGGVFSSKTLHHSSTLLKVNNKKKNSILFKQKLWKVAALGLFALA